jgi:hypothetical protein
MLEESGGGGDNASGDDQPDAQTQQPQCETFWRGRRLGIFRFFCFSHDNTLPLMSCY